MYGQMSFADDSTEYKEFVDKFKPKKTTDDCYTPSLVYEAVAEWVAAEYGLDRSTFVRPFYPGGDYVREEYPEGCAVVDNPPFSILAEICRHYQSRSVPFFLFAPGLTCLSRVDGVCAVAASCDITYENGASVRTSFVTNLEPEYAARSAPDLTAAVHAAVKEARDEDKNELPKYEFPSAVITAARLGWMSIHGTDFRIRRDESAFVTTLDAMKGAGKSGIFGGGLLLTEDAAARRADAERETVDRMAEAARAAAECDAFKVDDRGRVTFIWQLSEREQKVQEMLARIRDKANGG